MVGCLPLHLTGLLPTLVFAPVAFPRFFFIADDELLSVLGTSDPTSIRVHLLKLFDNVKDFGFVRNNKQVSGVVYAAASVLMTVNLAAFCRSITLVAAKERDSISATPLPLTDQWYVEIQNFPVLVLRTVSISVCRRFG